MGKHNVDVIFEETGKPADAFGLVCLFWGGISAVLVYAVVLAVLELTGITNLF